MEAPDYFEPTLGWRAWLVVQTPEDRLLSIVLYPTVWVPRQEEFAVCGPDATGRDPHEPRRTPPRTTLPLQDLPTKSPTTRPGTSTAGRGPIKPLFQVMGTRLALGTVIEGDRVPRFPCLCHTGLYMPVNQAHHRHRRSRHGAGRV